MPSQTAHSDSDALHLHGIAKLQGGKTDEAIDLIRRAISLRPDAPEFHNNLGSALARKGSIDDAIAAFSRAIELRPTYAKALANLGAALTKTGRYAMAEDSYRRSLAADPDSPEARWNYGLLRLRQGDFPEGLREYEFRLQLPELAEGKRRCAEPRWDGTDLAGKRILLHAEQGFGDTIQFIRFAPLVAAKGGNVILEVQPEIRRLFMCLDGMDVLSRGEQLPAFDVQCPIPSLPLALGATLQTIPLAPYLRSTPPLIEKWRMVGRDSTRINVGIVWAGNPTQRNDRNRSMPITAFDRLGQIPNVNFFSLQKGAGAEQVRQCGFPITDLAAHIEDFADTAALIEKLDLVISVCTATAHLAGALGKRVWVPLCFAADWRWLIDREDSPWYPTMRLFRQKAAGYWDDPVHRIALALERLAHFHS